MHSLGNHERESSMNRPRVASAAEWLAAREEPLVKVKEATRTRDALAAERRRLPIFQHASYRETKWYLAQEIILIHHTDCGMLTFSDDELKAQIHEDVGLKPHFSMESFSDLEEDVRQSIARIQASPFILHKGSVRGFIYELETGRLREVA
jgi:hypothetical protein